MVEMRYLEVQPSLAVAANSIGFVDAEDPRLVWSVTFVEVKVALLSLRAKSIVRPNNVFFLQVWTLFVDVHRHFVDHDGCAWRKFPEREDSIAFARGSTDGVPDVQIILHCLCQAKVGLKIDTNVL